MALDTHKKVARWNICNVANSKWFMRRRRPGPIIFVVIWVVFFLFILNTFTDIFSFIPEYLDRGSENNVRLYRDVYTQERWPEMETDIRFPREIPFTVHYFWCGKKMFQFENYLSLLSAVRVLKPQKIIFYYHDLPIVDQFWYNTWFQELKQSVPNLVLRYTSRSPNCGTKKVLSLVLSYIAKEGGIYLGERTLVTHVPREARFSDFLGFHSHKDMAIDMTQALVFSKGGFDASKLEDNIYKMFNSAQTCYTVEEFNNITNIRNNKNNMIDHSYRRISIDKNCLTIKAPLYPKDIWNSSTRFGEFARWLFYGQRNIFQVKPDPEDVPLIPMISHMVWIRTNNILKNNELKFLHYLSVLSALYVAKFEHVYIHGEISPYGHWWDRLRGHNVTYIKIEKPETIFQQEVNGPSHQSDVVRLNTLLRHGGVYQDRDVIWVSEIPKWLRRYQAVACIDWPRYGEWPEAFNLGVIMAKPNAQWLKHFLKTFSYYRDDKWSFNAIQMPYKAYELYPDTLYVDRHLQVICFKGICHPGWHEDYKRDMEEKTPVRAFDWRSARAYHFTLPKPPQSLTSPEEIKNGNDMYSEMGRHILTKSGQADLLM